MVTTFALKIEESIEVYEYHLKFANSVEGFYKNGRKMDFKMLAKLIKFIMNSVIHILLNNDFSLVYFL